MPKKIPQRQCLGCREMKAKRDLIRIVRAPDGSLSLDFRGKASGRGAYVCPSRDCMEKARKSKAINRSLDTTVPDDVWDALFARLEEGDAE